MEFRGVLISVAGGFGFGAAWYMTLSKPWMKAAGIKITADGKSDGNGSPLPFVLSGIAMVLVAGMMRHVFVLSGITAPSSGLIYGLGIGLFFIIPCIMIGNAYGMRPFELTLIDGGYATFGCAVIGLILTMFI